MNSIIHIRSSDYEWLYLNGELFADGHSISPKAWFMLGQHCLDTPFKSIQHYTVNEQYIEENGDLPFEFDEIPKVILSET